tara:strand:+ start:177 stop:356 length:180 start_codon:yes stop_codon:yes gene_type:complete
MEKTKVVNVTERANSFCGRTGGVGTDFKIYWDTLEDLVRGLKAVNEGAKIVAGMQGPTE